MRACTSMRRETTSGLPLLLALALAFVAIEPSDAGAESAWIRGEVRLNVRTGPGTQYRIVGGLKTGDHVEIRQRTDEWMKVGLDDSSSGWIPVGYLASEQPAALKLARLESETAILRDTSSAAILEVGELKQSNEQLSLQDSEQRLEIDQLRRENMRLKAGARWPEWITGALIVCVGMVVGAILQRTSGRRTSTRIRL